MSDFKSNPILIDSVMAESYKQATGDTEYSVVPLVVFHAKAGEQFEITDGQLKVWLASEANRDDAFSYHFTPPGTIWSDFKVTKLTGNSRLFIFRQR